MSGRVRSGSALADSDRTRKPNPGFGMGPLSVRLGLVGTVPLPTRIAYLVPEVMLPWILLVLPLSKDFDNFGKLNIIGRGYLHRTNYDM